MSRATTCVLWRICATIAACLIVAGFVLALGCQSSTRIKPGSTSIAATSVERDPVVAHQQGTIKHKDGSVESYTRVEQGGAVVETKEQAESVGTGAEAHGDKLTQDVQTNPTELTLPSGGGAKGGGGRSSTTALTTQGAWKNPVLWVGVLCILLAGAATYLRVPRAPLILGVCGGGLICAAFVPAWGWFIIAAVGLAGLGVYLWAEYSGTASKEALRAVVAGVANAPKEAAEAIKTEVSKHADPRDVRTITAVKLKDRL